jgi:hypothetical protein
MPRAATRLPTIGVLKLDTAFERFIGDIGNPASLPYPVLLETVHGATASKVTTLGDDALLAAFIEAGHRLIARGADAITTTCGFLVLYQRELAAALTVPVATSSLLQVAAVRALLPQDKLVGVITFSAGSLGPRHLAAAGAPADTPIAGLDPESPMVLDILGQGRPTTFAERERTSLDAAEALQRGVPGLGAVVIECTNIAPHSAAIAQALGVPVFDAMTLVEWLASAVRPHVYGEVR